MKNEDKLNQLYWTFITRCLTGILIIMLVFVGLAALTGIGFFGFLALIPPFSFFVFLYLAALWGTLHEEELGK